MSNEKLVFVYLGNKLPRYGRKSIKMAQQYSGLDVVLVCEKRFRFTGLDKAETYLLSSNYKSKLSQNLANSINVKFRNGFWLKTIERFFALEEYMQAEQIERCFHAELDNVVFANDELVKVLNSFGSGLFIPFDSPNRAIASFIYLNSLKTLQNFCQFAEQIGGNYNDMELLAMYGAMNPVCVFALPSSMENNTLKTQLLHKGIRTVDELDSGIFDAAAIGQWYFGIDPRNSHSKISNRFKNEVADLDLDQFRMRWNEESSCFYASELKNSQTEYFVNNLHIHSKIYRKIGRPGMLVSIVNRTDSGKVVVIKRNVIGRFRALKDLSLKSALKMRECSRRCKSD